MNAWDVLRRTTTAAFLTVALVVGPLPAARLAAQVDAAGTPETVASAWAREMLRSLRTNDRRKKAGNLVALQPLDPGTFSMLDARQRRQIYERLLTAFTGEVHDFYSVVDVSRLPDFAKIQEEAGAVSDKPYLDLLKSAKVRINIICKGESGADAVKLSCSASDFGEKGKGVSLGDAEVSFKLEWLDRPVALELAVRSFASAVVQQMKGSDRLEKTRVVDVDTGQEMRFVATMLEDAIHKRIRNYRGRRAVGTGKAEAAAYRVEGEIWRQQGKTVLRVVIQVGERRIHMGREYVAVPDDFGRESGGTPDPLDPGAVFLPEERMSLKDWVTVAAPWRLEKGEYTRLLAEANAHIENYRNVTDVKGVEKVRERAIAGLLKNVRLDTRADAQKALRQLRDIRKLAGEPPTLLRLMAEAHRLSGDYKSERDVLGRWLRAKGTKNHPKRGEVVEAQMRVQEMLAQHERFAELLGRPSSRDTVDGDSRRTDLHYAAVLDLPGVIAALVDAGMAVDNRDYLDETPLHHAATYDAVKAVKYLAGRGADVNAKDKYGKTPLHFAAGGDAVKVAEYLVGRGADINAKDEEGKTPLHFAAGFGAVKVWEYLVVQGADINAKDKYDYTSMVWAYGWRSYSGETPLQYAAENDAVKAVKFLMGRGADVNAKDKSGGTPLHYAAQNDAVKVMEYLVGRGADVNAKDNDGVTPLHAAALGDAVEAAEYLVSQKADIHAKSDSGNTPLHYAAQNDAVKVVKYLVGRGADVNAKHYHDFTPLHYAAQNDAVKVAEYLVGRGADVNAKDKSGGTPLHHAARGDAVKVAEYLVGRGADVNAKRLLRYAARNRAVKVVEYLMVQGADINEEEKSGFREDLWYFRVGAAENDAVKVVEYLVGQQGRYINTKKLLRYAARNDAVKVVEYLVGQGVDINTKKLLRYAAWNDAVKVVEYLVGQGVDINTKKLLRYAAGEGAVKVVEYLVGRGADVNAKDKYGKTPLHYAAGEGAVKVVEYLVGRGADVNAKDKYGKTPLHYAAWEGAVKVAEYLVGRGADIHAKNNDGETPLYYAVVSPNSSVKVVKFLEDFSAKAGE